MDLLQLQTDLEGGADQPTLVTAEEPEERPRLVVEGLGHHQAAHVAEAKAEGKPRNAFALHLGLDGSSLVAGQLARGARGVLDRLSATLASLHRHVDQERYSLQFSGLQGNEPQMLAWLLAAIGLSAAYCTFANRHAEPAVAAARPRTATFGQNPDQDPSEWADDEQTMAVLSMQCNKSFFLGRSDDGESVPGVVDDARDQFVRALITVEKNLTMGTAPVDEEGEGDDASTDEEAEPRFS